MKLLLAALPLAAVVAFAACQSAPHDGAPEGGRGGGEPDGVLFTDRQSYSAGATLLLGLRNPYEHELGYNLCTSTLLRRAAGAWEPVPEDRVCTMELRLLPPGGTADFEMLLPADLPAGEYRYGTRLEEMGTGTEIRAQSNVFTVTR